jgi:hypothetical protein
MQTFERIAKQYRTAKDAVLRHKLVSAVVSVGAVGLFWWGLFIPEPPGLALYSALAQALPMITPGVAVSVAGLVAWLVLAFWMLGDVASSRLALADERNKVRRLEVDNESLRLDVELYRTASAAASMERDNLREAAAGHDAHVEQLRYELGESYKHLAQWDFKDLVRVSEEEAWGVSVTLRFIEFEDAKTIDLIENILQKHAPKWPVTKERNDGSNLRQPDGVERLLFESKNTHLAGNTSACMGRLVGVRSSYRERDDARLLVTLFPKRKD